MCVLAFSSCTYGHAARRLLGAHLRSEYVLGAVINFLPEHLLRYSERLTGGIDSYKLTACVHEAFFTPNGLPQRSHPLSPRAQGTGSEQAESLSCWFTCRS